MVLLEIICFGHWDLSFNTASGLMSSGKNGVVGVGGEE